MKRVLQNPNDPRLSYPAPDGYEITIARRGDEAGMTEVQMRAFVEGYQYADSQDADPIHRRTAEHLGAFVRDSVPNVGFYDRMMTHWGSLTEGNQPDGTRDQLALVARDHTTRKIVGIGTAAKQLQPRSAYPHRLADIVEDVNHISALYVDPEHQGRKIGSALLTALAKHLGPINIAVAVTRGASAIEFYKKHGFKVMSGWPVGAPLWPMRRQGILLEQVAMFCRDFEAPKPTQRSSARKVAADKKRPAYV